MLVFAFKTLSHQMSHTSSVLVWWRNVDMDMPTCVVSLEFLCSSGIGEAHGNTYCTADHLPPLFNTHTFLCDPWRAHMSLLHWMKANMHCQRWKKESHGRSGSHIMYSFLQTPQQTLSHSKESSTDSCFCDKHSGEFNLCFYRSLCVNLHTKIYIHVPESVHLSDFTLTGSVLYLTLYPEILELA